MAMAMFAAMKLNIPKEREMRNQNLFVKKLTALVMALMVLFASSATRVEAATPDLTPQQMEAVIEDAFAGLVAFDVQRVVNNFAADAVVEDPVGTPPIVGTQAIAAYLETFPTLFSQMKLYSLDIKTGGQEAGVTWRIRFTTKTGKVFFLEGIGHFKFNQDGKIQTEKEFFDLAYFLSQL
jgi:steroid delta-isomerase